MASRLAAHAVNHIGSRGKRYGFVSNDGFHDATGGPVRQAVKGNTLELNMLGRIRRRMLARPNFRAAACSSARGTHGMQIVGRKAGRTPVHRQITPLGGTRLRLEHG